MASLADLCTPFSQLPWEEQLEKIKAARFLRRQRLPEKVRKTKAKPKAATKTTRKKRSEKAYNAISKDKRMELIEAMIAKKKKEGGID